MEAPATPVSRVVVLLAMTVLSVSRELLKEALHRITGKHSPPHP
jgi:hypothetical protein